MTLKEKLASAKERHSQTVEIDDLGAVEFRALTWGEQADVEQEDDPTKRAYLWLAALARDPKSGEALFEATDEGYQAFRALPLDLAGNLLRACREAQEKGRAKKNSPAKKSSRTQSRAA